MGRRGRGQAALPGGASVPAGWAADVWRSTASSNQRQAGKLM
ncbi:MAG: hypothetical protein ACLRRT_08050 [Ruthenibacterium lactatiformans]